MGDKSDLLNKLTIDRNQVPEKPGIAPFWLAVVAVLAAGGGTVVGMQFGSGDTAATQANTKAPKTSTAADKPPPQQMAPVVDTSNRILNASGYITARRVATVSAEVLGLIREVRVEEGMEVTEGQILALLDDTLPAANLRVTEAQVNVLTARVQSIQANLREAERVLRRATELKSNDFSTEASVTRARADTESLKAQLASAEADIIVAKLDVERQRERLDDYTIRAPFSGVVTVKAAQPGEIVSPSSAGGGFTRTGICTIVDMDSLEIEVDVNEAYIQRVVKGQTVEANLDAYPSWNIPATVLAIIPTADRAKATVKVRIRIDVKDQRILPDMGVKVAFLKT